MELEQAMRGVTRGVKTAIVCLVCAGVWLLAASGTVALAGGPGTVSHAQAKAKVKAAARAVERAEARLGEARAVADATQHFTDIYGSSVGRWVWLAQDVGWPRTQWGRLFYVINRESRGQWWVEDYLHSGHFGLMQLAHEWYTGDWPISGKSRTFDPTNPRLNLYWGYRIWRDGGWSPWAL